MTTEHKPQSEPVVDIGPTIDALCGQFDLEKTLVTQIIFEPMTLTFTVLDHNDEGRPFIRDDGHIASSELSYRVTT